MMMMPHNASCHPHVPGNLGPRNCTTVVRLQEAWQEAQVRLVSEALQVVVK